MKTIITLAAAAAGVALRGVLLIDRSGGRGVSGTGVARPRAAWRIAEGVSLSGTIQRDSVGVVPV